MNMTEQREKIYSELVVFLRTLTERNKIDWVDQGDGRLQTEITADSPKMEFIIRRNGDPIDSIFGYTLIGPNLRVAIILSAVTSKDRDKGLWGALNTLWGEARRSADSNIKHLIGLLAVLNSL